MVNQAGGIAIKVGLGETVAEWRLADVASVWQWISDIANQQQQQIAQNKGETIMGRLVVVSNRIAPPDDKNPVQVARRLGY